MLSRGRRSRNKVSVGEPADGSFLFYFFPFGGLEGFSINFTAYKHQNTNIIPLYGLYYDKTLERGYLSSQTEEERGLPRCQHVKCKCMDRNGFERTAGPPFGVCHTAPSVTFPLGHLDGSWRTSAESRLPLIAGAIR